MSTKRINDAVGSMTAAQIRERMDILQREKDAIDAQVAEAKRLAAAGEGFSDPVWLTDAEAAARARGRNIGRLQIALSAALRSERAQRAAQEASLPTAFERRFIRKAREVLPRALYEQILSEAAETDGLKEGGG